MEKGLTDKISASIEDRGLVIRISESAFFDLGSAELKEQAKGILDLFGGILNEIPNHAGESIRNGIQRIPSHRR